MINSCLRTPRARTPWKPVRGTPQGRPLLSPASFHWNYGNAAIIASSGSRNHQDRLDASAEGFFSVAGAAFEGSEEVHEAFAQGRWQRRHGWSGILSPNGKVKEGAIRPKEGVSLADFYEAVMKGYTYLGV